jgi:hypothetical protein
MATKLPIEVPPPPTDLSWMERARCSSCDTEAFFPDPTNRNEIAIAKRICGNCDVREKCLDYALNREGKLSAPHRHGIFGGTTPGKRWLLTTAKHGSDNSARMGCRCDECEAYLAKRREVARAATAQRHDQPDEPPASPPPSEPPPNPVDEIWDRLNSEVKRLMKTREQFGGVK